MKIAVFGGARPLPNEKTYKDALLLGELLGQQGHTVMTGGYAGTMEAVSKGAAAKGAHVIGVTCLEIEKWRGSSANPWVKEERKLSNLQDRMNMMIEECDAAFALPGGAGTLTEIMVMWNRILIHAITPKHLILIGSGWKQTFDMFFNVQLQNLHTEDKQWLKFADTVSEAVTLL